jgi:DNA-binding SARP family transcriptional activator/tetratricopeptide (TPR) repeat protein
MTLPSEMPSSPRPRIRIGLLGSVAVDVDGEALKVDTRKAVALLAFLAVARRPESRESLAALLWPEADGADARGALRRTLSVLRSGLGETGLVVDRDSVTLDRAVVDVDLWRFEAALAAARAHEHPDDALCPTCGEALRAAAGLDRGGFMSGFALRDSEAWDDWHLAESGAYRRELAAVLERLARGEAHAHAWDRASAAARRWLELDPLHEPAHRLLMEVLARAGEPAAALAQYRDCVRTLDRELGVAPLPETTELADAIRGGLLGPSPDPAAATGPLGTAPTRTRADGAPDGAPGGDARPVTSPPLIGRDAEMRTLERAIDGIGPAGRLLVLEGEPGIGKTRLAEAVAQEVQARGGLVLQTRAYAGEAAIPLSSIAELVRAGFGMPDARDRLEDMDPALLAEASRLLPLPGVAAVTASSEADPFGRLRLFDGLASVLASLVRGPAPGLIWVDDLQLADASTLEFLGFMLRRLADIPVAILVSWRVEDLEPGLRDRILGPARSSGLATTVTLGRLGREEVARLVDAVLGGPVTDSRIEGLWEESEGLPLYVIEALADPDAGASRTPRGVQALLRSRVDVVGDVGRQILAAAAVIGRSFDPALVRATSGRSDDETVDGIEELIRRGLVREVDTSAPGDLRLDFTHARIRDVVYEGLSLSRRRLLHGRVATALATGHGTHEGRVRWSVIAYHETLAGRTAAAAEAHRRAGDDARAIFANEEAREHLEAALALGHPDVAMLHGALGEVLTLLGDYEAALFHLASAAALAGPEEQAALDHRQGLVHVRRGEWVQAEGHLVAALAATEDPAMRSRILADRSAIADRSGDPEQAARFAREALALAESVGDPVGMARALDLLGILARRRGDLASARRDLERAISIADGPGPGGESGPATRSARVIDPGVEIAALNTLALVLADQGDRTRAIELTRDALAGCERQGDRHRQAALENNLADLLHAVGRSEEAMEHLKRAVALFAEVGGTPGELEPEIWKLVEW